DHEGEFFRRNLVEETGYSERRIRVRWGGARIKDRYRWAAWRGKITITNGVINGFKGVNFEHDEESCWREGVTVIRFRSDTYGDADAVEIDLSNLRHCRIRIEGTIDGYVKVGDPLKGNPFPHCPDFVWETTGEESLAGAELRHELGGQDLFLAIERMSDAALPRDVAGSIQVEPSNGPHGFRPVYFAGRQRNSTYAWASAMFITFK